MRSAATEARADAARSTLLAALLGFFVITLDAVVVNVALPTIGHELGASVGGLQWVVDGYTLMFAALLLSAGALSDRVGARRAFGYGLLVFVAASVGCGLARSLSWLVAARFVQGAGAAALMPASMALIRQAFPDPVERGRAVAAWAMGGAVAATSGPLVGGLLTSLDWRWIFFINVPVGLLTAVFLLRASPSPKRPAAFDGLSQVVAIAAMGGLVYGAIESGERGFADTMVWGSLGVALGALTLFIWLQRVRSSPLLPSAVLASRNAKLAVLIGFTFMVGYFGLPFLMSLYLQQQRGLSPLETGMAFLPMMATGVVLTPFSARVVERWGARACIVVGLMVMTLGLVLLWALVESASVGVIAAVLVVVGLGGPMVAPPVTAVLLGSVPAGLAGTASGVFHTSRQLGGALAVAVFGALLVRSESFMSGLHASLILAAGVALLTAGASMGLRPIQPTYAGSC